MTIRPVLIAPDPKLRQISRVVEVITPEHKTLISDMFDTMYAEGGIGLAAIQIGAPLRILVMDIVWGEEEEKQPRCFINPEIIKHSEQLKPYREGCLSLPDIQAEIDRPAIITARWQDEEGKHHEEVLEGLLAVCLQHEMDHLEGILLIDHLSRLKREKALAQLRKAARRAPAVA